MHRHQGFGLTAAMVWGLLGSIAFGALSFYLYQDFAATATVAIGAPVVTVFLYLFFERLTANRSGRPRSR